MDTIKIPIPIPYSSNYEVILNQWKWFRKHLMRIYNMQHLAESFKKGEGKISENTRLEDDDIMYDMTPAEFNYNWYNQKLEFKDGLQVATIEIEIADFGPHRKFTYENEFKNSKIVFYLSSYKEHRSLRIARNSLYKLLWKETLEELKELDDRKYEGI